MFGTTHFIHNGPHVPSAGSSPQFSGHGHGVADCGNPYDGPLHSVPHPVPACPGPAIVPYTNPRITAGAPLVVWYVVCPPAMYAYSFVSLSHSVTLNALVVSDAFTAARQNVTVPPEHATVGATVFCKCTFGDATNTHAVAPYDTVYVTRPASSTFGAPPNVAVATFVISVPSAVAAWTNDPANIITVTAKAAAREGL